MRVQLNVRLVEPGDRLAINVWTNGHICRWQTPSEVWPPEIEWVLWPEIQGCCGLRAGGYSLSASGSLGEAFDFSLESG